MKFVFWVISLSWNLFSGLLVCHQICLYSPLFFYFIWFVWYWLDVYNFLGDGSLCFTQFCAVVFFVWFGWLKHTCELKVEITRVRNRRTLTVILCRFISTNFCFTWITIVLMRCSYSVASMLPAERPEAFDDGSSFR